MTKKDIITALEKAGIDYNPTALKSELESLLEVASPRPVSNDSLCEQKGCPDAEETDEGLCSVCGHPIGEHREELLAATG